MKRRYDTERQIIIQHGTRPVSSLRELLDESEATGTGSGVPLLVRLNFPFIMVFATFELQAHSLIKHIGYQGETFY